MNSKIATVLMLGMLAGPLSAAEKLTVVSFGGNNRQAQEKAFYKPFTSEKKVAITADDYNGEMAKIRVMADTGKTSWDVVEVESPSCCAVVAKACSSHWTGRASARKKISSRPPSAIAGWVSSSGLPF